MKPMLLKCLYISSMNFIIFGHKRKDGMIELFYYDSNKGFSQGKFYLAEEYEISDGCSLSDLLEHKDVFKPYWTIIIRSKCDDIRFHKTTPIHMKFTS